MGRRQVQIRLPHGAVKAPVERRIGLAKHVPHLAQIAELIIQHRLLGEDRRVFHLVVAPLGGLAFVRNARRTKEVQIHAL